MNLNHLFYPRSLAIIGASDKPGKLGYNVLRNLIDHGYEGSIYPINPKGGTIQGLKAHRCVGEIDDDIDAAVAIVPAVHTVKVVEECFQKGIKFVTIESAGFGELGDRGRRIETDLETLIDEHGGHILGPNCSGIINVNNGLCQSIGLVGDLRPGNVGLIAQAGVYAAGILWGLRNIMDFSMIATIGNKMDIDETDILGFMGADPTVSVIAMYLEDIRRGNDFLRVAREVTPNKPIVVLKGGRTEEGKARAITHTAALGGSDQAYEAIFHDGGVIIANDNDHLFDLVRGFSKQPLPSTDGVMVITYSGSQGITATDRLNENGMRLATLSEGTARRIGEIVPDMVATINPADMTFDQSPSQVKDLVEAAALDPNVGSILVNLQPEILADYVVEMERVETHGKPMVISVSGREFVMEHVVEMERKGVPVYSTTERAAEVLASMWRYSCERLATLRSEPDARDDPVNGVLDSINDGTVGGNEVFKILEAYGIGVVECRIAKSPEEAESIAGDYGGPVVYKIESPRLLHKSDAGGVMIDIRSDFREAYTLLRERVIDAMPDLDESDIDGICIQPMLRGGREVLIGCTLDRATGSHIMKVGTGGKYTEIFRDVVNGVVPIDAKGAMSMIERTRYIGRLLEGARGDPPSDIGAVVDVIVRLSRLVQDHPSIVEIEINPLLVWESGVAVVDARMAISGSGDEDPVKEDGSIERKA
jgi:acyl-CoA synthetase (NDP forming)